MTPTASSLFSRPLEVSPGNYNLSISEASSGSFTATSSLQVMAVRSSEVTCLASVSALKEPESSSARLTVGETQKTETAVTETRERKNNANSSLSQSKHFPSSDFHLRNFQKKIIPYGGKKKTAVR